MRIRIRTVLLGGLLALTCSATASASAATPGWFIEGKSLSQQEAVNTASSTPVKFTIQNWFTVECKSASLPSSEALTGGQGTASSLSLKECAMTSPVHCVVKKNLTTGAVDSDLFYAKGSEVWDEYAASGGGVLMTLEITECGVEGKYQISGSFCAKESSPASEAIVKQQVFGVPSGEGAKACRLKFGLNPGGLEGTMASSLAGSQLGDVWTGK